MKLMKLMVIALLVLSSNAMALPKAKITVKVVDEAGSPIEGAKAVIGFTMPRQSGGWGSVATGQNDLTDDEGLFSAEGETEPHVGLAAMKDGYYRTTDKFNQFKEITGIIGFRKWQPWNPTVELVLKEKKEPIPLYAVNLHGSKKPLPELGKFIGFDLVARDWVVPHGSGTRKDFLFKIDVNYLKSMFEHDITLTLKFANPDDGILSVYDKPNKGSMLRLPHHAPLSGYEPELVLRIRRDKTRVYTPQPRDDQNYFFRVRSESDGKGNITSALYGKIHGNIAYSVQPLDNPTEGIISFSYYLNPKSNDTNLEFDPKKNLFTDLKGWEAIGLTP